MDTLRRTAMASEDQFRVRLRFRTTTSLAIKARDHDIVVGGRPVRITAQEEGKTIAESGWLIMNARGVSDQESACAFGKRLKQACEVASAVTRLGLDAGTDVSTSGFGAAVKARVREATGCVLRDDVHGLDVFVDDPKVAFISLRGTATVHASPDAFVGLVDTVYPHVGTLSQRCRDILLLLNHALLRTDHVAQIVFSISAVEMLGQACTWSSAQLALLDELARHASQSPLGTLQEREEVADAIRRGSQRVSLRQGVFRLLDELGLADLRRKWDTVYGDRSRLVHGLAPRPGAEYGTQAFETVSLCGRILLAVVAREVPGIASHFETYYQLPAS